MEVKRSGGVLSPSSTGNTKRRASRSLFSFAYKNTVHSMQEILPLFADYAIKQQNRTLATPCIESLDLIVEKGLEGKIRVDEEFNLEGYAYKVKFTDKLKEKQKIKRKKKGYSEISMETPVGQDENSTTSLSDIVAFKNWQDEMSLQQDVFESDVSAAIKSLKDIREELLVEEQVDIIQLIKSALEDSQIAISALRDICVKYAFIGEYVKTVLTSGLEVKYCFD